MKKQTTKKSKQPPAQSQRQPQTTPHRPEYRQMMATWKGRIFAVFAFFGVVQAWLVTFNFFRDLYLDTVPEIQLTGDSKEPLTLPILVRNRSKLFDMTDVVWTCGIDNVTGDGVSIKGVGFHNLSSPTRIAADGSQAFSCGLVRAGIHSARIVPMIEYKTFGLHRSFDGKKLTWYGGSSPPRWILTDNP